MALFFADLVRERSSATGAGDFALGGPLPGHRGFASVVPSGARFHYGIAGVTRPDQWETGEGEIGGDGRLRRTPIASSVGGAAVDFAAGLKTVALTVSAAWFAAHDINPRVADVTGLEAALADKQAADPTLAALAAVDGAADRVAYFTGPNSAALTPLTGFGRTLIGASGASAARAQLGVGDDPSFGGTLHAAGGTFGDTVSAGAINATFVSAGTGLQLGAITAAGGNAFSGVPPFGTATIGRILHSTGWSGSGFLFANGTSGGKAFSMVYDVDVAFFGLVGAGGFTIVLTIQENRADFFNTVRLSPDGVAVGGIPVLGGRRGGWGTPTGAGARTTFDTESVTTAQLAQRVKALIDDLTAHGLIGA